MFVQWPIRRLSWQDTHASTCKGNWTAFKTWWMTCRWRTKVCWAKTLFFEFIWLLCSGRWLTSVLKNWICIRSFEFAQCCPNITVVRILTSLLCLALSASRTRPNCLTGMSSGHRESGQWLYWFGDRSSWWKQKFLINPEKFHCCLCPIR